MLSHEAAVCLEAMGMKVTGKQYNGLAHWYFNHMLSDLVPFSQRTQGKGVEIEKEGSM